MKVVNQKKSRREFLSFLGKTGVTVYAFSLMNTVDGVAKQLFYKKPTLPFIPVEPSALDELILPEGFSYRVIAKWGDSINAHETFGFNNDFLAFFPINGNSKDGLLWVNHEYTSSLFVSGYKEGKGVEKTRDQVIKEMDSVGGSIIRIQQDESGQWNFISDDSYNRRLTARTPIPFAWNEPIAGSTMAIGTLANCAGGITPWGTVLTCEENYDTFWGERDFKSPSLTKKKNGLQGWEDFFDYPPEHYGWVVEVNIYTGEAKKLISMGRCQHECATVVRCEDGRCVVYTGDDEENEHLYKFIADKPGSLERGSLYVADILHGRWLSLDFNKQPILKNNFKNQTEVLIRLREAAKLVGATPLNRPEDIEINPANGDVIVSLTNNKPKGDLFGSLLRIKEKNNNPLSLEFEATTFLTGGPETGFACPDNLAFDPKGNLWFTSDISGTAMHKGSYAQFKNNGLFYVPMKGASAGKVFQIASAPTDAELTGPFFSPDGETLFLSVQHPGEMSSSLSSLTSHWPEGGEAIPKPAVVAITGPALRKLME